MAKRNVSYLKPPKFQQHLTLSELSAEVERDPSWLRELEAKGRIPRAVRVARGKIEVRLWSPAQVKEIKEILATHRPGRPSNG